MPKTNILTRKKRDKARAFFQNNQLADAEKSYIQLLQRNPLDIEALQILGTITFRQNRLTEAKKYFEQALVVSPQHSEVWYQLGCLNDKVDDKTGDKDNAKKQFENAIRFNENFIEARLALGNSEASLGLLGKATEQYQAILAINPKHIIAKNNLANVVANQGNAEEALSLWNQVLQQQPDYYSAYSNKLLALNYLANLSQVDIFKQHTDWAKQQSAVTKANDRFNNTPVTDRTLHIAYVSADFREHSVAYFIDSILKHHSKENFKIFCYSNASNHDTVSERLFSYVDTVRQISHQTDETVANWVRQDKIDILIDLAGHTSGNRLPLFARKPAPIQITYLGYPNTTGLETIDYRLADEITDPAEDNQAFTTEKLLKIPGGFLCYTPPLAAPDVARLPLLKNNYITFGVFNNVAKITPECVKVWSQVLQQVANSKIIFKNKSFSDPDTCLRYQALFEANNISADRLQFSGLTSSKTSYLDFYNQVDITLDSFPYNGTTTTFDSLYMGVPTITLAGDRHASRVGASILHRVEQDNLVATTHQEYIDIAVALSNKSNELKIMKQSMRATLTASTLCDGNRMTRELETIYREVWKVWCSGSKK